MPRKSEHTYKYSLFQAYGVELEYMIVNKKTLDVAPIADVLFEQIFGEITSEIESGPVTYNNELALHVVELKTTDPAPDLSPLAKIFHEKVQELNLQLSKLDACLMPSGMHPWMDPHKETRLWPHGSAEIYNAFNAIFNCSGHGWGNLQSVHLNLPFSTEEEFVKLHRSIRMVLPLIPTLAASSPFVEGRNAMVRDKRLDVYRYNCKKIPSVTGYIIPEACDSYAAYEKKILERIYKDILPYDPNGLLRHEWLNARGAITRFERGSIEIRLIDIQENPYQDITILEAFSRLIKYLMQKDATTLKKYDLFSEERLRGLLELGIQSAEDAVYQDREYPHLFGIEQSKISASELWRHIFSELIEMPKAHRQGVELLLEEGTLATRLLKQVGGKVDRKSLSSSYGVLCDCLQRGTPFIP